MFNFRTWKENYVIDYLKEEESEVIADLRYLSAPDKFINDTHERYKRYRNSTSWQQKVFEMHPVVSGFLILGKSFMFGCITFVVVMLIFSVF